MGRGSPAIEQTSRSPPLSALCERHRFVPTQYHVHPNSPTTRTRPTTPAHGVGTPEIAKTENQKTPPPKKKKKRNKRLTSQGVHGLVWPFLRYLDLEFAHAEFEVDEFGDEVLCLRLEDLFGE